MRFRVGLAICSLHFHSAVSIPLALLPELSSMPKSAHQIMRRATSSRSLSQRVLRSKRITYRNDPSHKRTRHVFAKHNAAGGRSPAPSCMSLPNASFSGDATLDMIIKLEAVVVGRDVDSGVTYVYSPYERFLEQEPLGSDDVQVESGHDGAADDQDDSESSSSDEKIPLASQRARIEADSKPAVQQCQACVDVFGDDDESEPDGVEDESEHEVEFFGLDYDSSSSEDEIPLLSQRARMKHGA